MRKVIGLVFRRTKDELRYPRFVGIEAWVVAGRPEPAFVYDHPGALVDATIRIGDAVYRSGLYHRTSLVDHTLDSEAKHAIRPASQRVKAFNARGAYTVAHEVVVVEPEVTAKATGSGNKMSRGVNKRSVKKEANEQED